MYEDILISSLFRLKSRQFLRNSKILNSRGHDPPGGTIPQETLPGGGGTRPPRSPPMENTHNTN